MNTMGSSVGRGATMRSLTQTESMVQRSQSSMKLNSASGLWSSKDESARLIPMRTFMVIELSLSEATVFVTHSDRLPRPLDVGAERSDQMLRVSHYRCGM